MELLRSKLVRILFVLCASVMILGSFSDSVYSGKDDKKFEEDDDDDDDDELDAIK